MCYFGCRRPISDGCQWISVAYSNGNAWITGMIVGAVSEVVGIKTANENRVEDQQGHGGAKVESKSPYQNIDVGSKVDGKIKIVERGNLPSVVKQAFKGQKYLAVKITEDITSYRKFGGGENQAKVDGGFVATTENLGRNETAVCPKWSGSQFEAGIEIPAGTKINIDKVAEQPIA